MGRVVVEVPMSTRNARAKLSPGIYWRSIDADTQLGYRKAVRYGTWVVRWRVGKGYRQGPLATADDAIDADGDSTLTFAQAESAARRHVAERRADEALVAAGPILTVQMAIDEYVTEREAREAPSPGRETGKKRDARSRLHRYVLTDQQLAEQAVGRLTAERLAEWRSGLPEKLAPASRVRLAGDFKAALNRAARVHRKKLPTDIEVTIRHGFATDQAEAPRAREAQVLADADVRRIVAAAADVDNDGDWGGDLARMVILLAATGARFSQLKRMAVADVQVAQKRVMVPASKKGRGTKHISKIAVRVGEDVLSSLRPLMAGRKGTDTLLIRPRRKQLKPTVWTTVSREAWSSASELARPWRAIIAIAGLPTDIVPYALRHSSIVRGLGAGLPVRLVAALHDTSSAMIERHYSAYIVDAMDELAAKAIVPLMGADIVEISEAKKSPSRKPT